MGDENSGTPRFARRAGVSVPPLEALLKGRCIFAVMCGLGEVRGALRALASLAPYSVLVVSAFVVRLFVGENSNLCNFTCKRVKLQKFEFLTQFYPHFTNEALRGPFPKNVPHPFWGLTVYSLIFAPT